MILTSWLSRLSLRSRSRSHRSRNRAASLSSRVRPGSVEKLENKTLLTVTSILNGTELRVFSDAGEDLVVSNNVTTGNVAVTADGAPLVALPSISSSALTSLRIITSGDNDSIDVSQVAATDFTSLTSVHIESGDGDDLLTGSVDFAETFLAGDGNDTINGQGGDDSAFGGDGDDSIIGAAGNELLDGGDGMDTITGGDGDDSILAGDGDDSVTGDIGNDTVDAGQGQDLVDGGDGNDSINGGAGHDTLAGGDGDDTLLGGSEHDSLDGGTGADSLSGQSGRDTLVGGDGDDTVEGGRSADSLVGGDGADFLNGNGGNDTLTGDVGDDRMLGGSGRDLMLGGDGDDVIRGQGGDDTILGGGGADSLDGGSGNDFVSSFIGEETGDASTATINVGNVSVPEASNGPTTADVTVTLSGVSGGAVNLNFTTQSGTATAGSDFVDFSGSLAFLPGETQKTVSIPILDDLAVEGDETFTVTFTSSLTALAGNPTGVVTIVDDEMMMMPVTAPVTVPEPVEDETQKQSVSTTSVVTPDGSTGGVLDNDELTLDDLTPDVTADGELDPSWKLSDGLRAPGSDFDPLAEFGDNLEDYTLSEFRFSGNSWTTTATDGGGLARGDSRTFTWGILPDGVTIPALGLGNAGPSNTIAQLDMLYNETAMGPDVTNRTWFALFQSVFDRIEELSGVIYVYEPNDNMGAFPATDGVVGVVPDIRIGARGLDGNSGVLAVNFVGPPGDMIIDLPDSFYNDMSNNSRALRNVVAHEHLHGLGYNHTIPTDGTKLMEPFANLSFDGPQFDDILGLHRQYGDVNETGMGNDTSTLATSLGSISFGQTVSIGLDAGPDTLVDPTDTDFVSIDGSDDIDVFSFTVPAGATVDVTLTPQGPTYQEGPQGGFATTFNSAAQSDLSFEVLDTDGMTVLATVNGGGLGFTETVTGLSLGANGTFFVRVTGATDAVQMFQLDVTIPAPMTPMPPGGNVDDLIADTLIGGSGRDTIIGSNAADTIMGSDDNDIINGFGGDDSIDGGGGDDSIDAGAGDDTINGGGGNDTINTSLGDDVVIWNGSGNGVDIIEESLGSQRVTVQGSSAVNNFVVSTSPSDSSLLQISEGSASITTSASVDEVAVMGGGGDDTLTVNSIDGSRPVYLVINGENGNDTITAAGASIGRVFLELRGGDGDDTISGSTGRDTIGGDAGNDVISGNEGDDQLSGGDGDDTISGGTGNDEISGGDGNDNLTGDDGTDSILGGFGNDVINGNDGNDTLEGGFGNDTLSGSAGDDSVEGNQGRDNVLGGSGNDTLKGGTDHDLIRGQGGHDSILGGDGDDTIFGNAGNDVIDAGDGDDSVQSNNGNDIIDGGDGNDTLQAGAGRDSVVGGDGNDALNGASGADLLFGDEGSDSLRGKGATDQFNSGEGIDTLPDLAGGEFDDSGLTLPLSLVQALTALNGV